MKCTEREVMTLISELDKQNSGQVNYREFLKFSYLCQMYIFHFKLHGLLLAEAKQGLVTVGYLEHVLQSGDFNFPVNAVDTVLTTMLGVPESSQIDHNCQIKVETFMESLRSQFLIN